MIRDNINVNSTVIILLYHAEMIGLVEIVLAHLEQQQLHINVLLFKLSE